MQRQWDHKIFNAGTADFEHLALEAFHHQYAQNPLYRAYCEQLNRDPATVRHIHQVPFLPIRFFKSHAVKTGDFDPQAVFESSGTTGTINSRHYVKDLDLYRQSLMAGGKLFYGDISRYCVIGLLPSYLERGNSSLVYMVNEWIHASGHPQSGFYLDDFAKLAAVLKELEAKRQPVLLIGVSFALLDFAERYPLSLQHTIIMETGGMKGRRQEMVRDELHRVLASAFSLPFIHSEYGMTELLSQAYSTANGIFNTVPWMKVLLRDEEDPLTIKTPEKSDFITGAINIIDLANIHSCCFIATDDAGRLYADGSFEVLGRLDNSDVRGCSLMYER